MLNHRRRLRYVLLKGYLYIKKILTDVVTPYNFINFMSFNKDKIYDLYSRKRYPDEQKN